MHRSGHMLVGHAPPDTPCPRLGSSSASTLAPAAAWAGVTRLEIVRREVVLNGQAFGAAGAYEKLVGRVHFALDPRTPQNQGIVDLALAPRNAQGLVEFSADFYLLKPVDPGPRQRPPLLRGRQPRQQAHPAGVPERRRLRRSDDRRGIRQRRADAPGLHAAVDGMAVGRAGGPDADGDPDRHRPAASRSPGWCAATSSPAPTPPWPPIADRNHEAYPVVDPEQRRARPLRAHAADRRAAGRAARRAGASPAPAPSRSTAASRPAASTTSSTAPAIRAWSASAWPARATWSASSSTPPPPRATRCRACAPAIGWGVSQTGRFLRHFVYQGFNEDERGRIVFDGVFDQVGGAGRGSFNHRFGQQSRDQLQHFNIQYPVDMFPFTDERRDRSGDRAAATACWRGRAGRTPCRRWSTC